jgi:hypothetical protein
MVGGEVRVDAGDRKGEKRWGILEESEKGIKREDLVRGVEKSWGKKEGDSR